MSCAIRASHFTATFISPTSWELINSDIFCQIEKVIILSRPLSFHAPFFRKREAFLFLLCQDTQLLLSSLTFNPSLFCWRALIESGPPLLLLGKIIWTTWTNRYIQSSDSLPISLWCRRRRWWICFLNISSQAFHVYFGPQPELPLACLTNHTPFMLYSLRIHQYQWQMQKCASAFFSLKQGRGQQQLKMDLSVYDTSKQMSCCTM